MWTDFVAYNMRCLRQVNGLGQLSRASRVFGVWRGRSRDQVCAVFLRYVDDCGAKKCGALVVCQDSLADALDDVLDHREAPEIPPMGGTHTHPQNLSPTEITKSNPCGHANTLTDRQSAWC
eukprot:COSAG01_NODE_370_length_18018_cov_142.063620_27_plen_121_part_00